MKNRIQTKIVASFVVVVMAMLAINMLNHWQARELEEQAKLAYTTQQNVMLTARQIANETNRIESLFRDYTVAGNPALLANAGIIIQKMQLDLNHLEQSLANEPTLAAIVSSEMRPQVNYLQGLVADSSRLGKNAESALINQAFANLHLAGDTFWEQQKIRFREIITAFADSSLATHRFNDLMNGLAAVIAVILGFFIAQSITSPLRLLVQGIRSISSGHYQLIDNIKADEEIGAVITAFNKMVLTIQSHEEDLRQKNEELQAQSEELAAQNEEITTQQEELQTTLEKLFSQEELLKSLYRFSQSLTQTIKLDELLPTILDGLMRETKAEAGALYLMAREADELVLRASRGLIHTADIERWRLGEGLLGQSAKDRQAAIVNYPGGQLRTKGLQGELALVSEIYSPIVFHDTLLGIAVIGRTCGQAFTCQEKQHIAGLTDQAAVALHNALTHLETHQALLRTKEVDKVKSELLSTVSHELRTPLASILGFSELLIKKPPNAAKAQKYLETIYSESIRLTELVNNFLDLQRIETGRFQFSKKPTDIGELIHGTAEIYQAQSSKHSFAVKVQDGLPPVVVDPDRIRQVLGNLLSNAIKYSPDGGVIEIRALQRGPQVEVEVQDHGLGIPAGDQKNLFQPFFRVDNSDRRKIGGTGLGLVISRKIIRAHGGDITIRSVLGEGSTFTVSLPLYETAPDKLAKGAGPKAQSQGRVLLVEDDEAMADLIVEALHENGYSVRVERNGLSALAAIKKETPAIIILDLILEGPLDGWGVLRRLKANEATADIPVIISSCVDEKQKGSELGASAYFVKPFSLEELIASVQTFSHMPAGAVGLGCSKKLSNDNKKLKDFIASKGFTVKEIINLNELSLIILDNNSLEVINSDDG